MLFFYLIIQYFYDSVKNFLKNTFQKYKEFELY